MSQRAQPCLGHQPALGPRETKATMQDVPQTLTRTLFRDPQSHTNQKCQFHQRHWEEGLGWWPKVPGGQSVLEQREANRKQPWLLLASARDNGPLPETPSCCYLGARPACTSGATLSRVNKSPSVGSYDRAWMRVRGAHRAQCTSLHQLLTPTLGGPDSSATAL